MPRHRWQETITIIKELPPELAVLNFEPGGVYDVNVPVSRLLVEAGFAEFAEPETTDDSYAGPDRRLDPD